MHPDSSSWNHRPVFGEREGRTPGGSGQHGRGQRMQPYRKPVVSSLDRGDPKKEDAGDVILLWILFFTAGVLPILCAAVPGGTWGAGPTVGLFVVLLVGGALLAHYIRRSRRAHRDEPRTAKGPEV